MSFRALGLAVLFIGLAAAQAPAAERVSRGPNRDLRADRTLDATRTPAERASRRPNRNLRADRALDAPQAPVRRASRGPSQDLRADRTSSDAAPRAPAARTPAERASVSLNQDVRADRFLNAAQDARGDELPVRPEIQQFLPQRRTLQPDVGRPEQDGRFSTEGIRGGLPGFGQNPQR